MYLFLLSNFEVFWFVSLVFESHIEFRKGDIEERIPIEDNSVDVVISNCVINLTSNKTNTFKEVYRILKKEAKGRMIISDLITTKEISKDNVNTNNWCSCIMVH